MEREALVETNAGMRGLGWLPDLPDVGDLTPEQPQITAMLEQTSVLKAQEALEAPPSKVDLRQYFSPIEDQGTLGSCTDRSPEDQELLGHRLGDEGYGAIPYEYIERGLAEDFWVILDAEWVKVDVFNQ
jgi:C1A family cysteine protease